MTAAQRPGMDAAMYVYQSTGQYAGTYRSYANGVGTSPLVVAGSGYFARVSAAGTPGAVNLTNANRVTSFGAQPVFGRGAADTRPQLHLQLAGASLSDDAYLYLQAGATAGVDAEFDATKLANPAGLDLATLSGSRALAINGLAPLGSGRGSGAAASAGAAGRQLHALKWLIWPISARPRCTCAMRHGHPAAAEPGHALRLHAGHGHGGHGPLQRGAAPGHGHGHESRSSRPPR